MITDPKIKRIDRRLTRAYHRAADEIKRCNGRININTAAALLQILILDIDDLVKDIRSDDV